MAFTARTETYVNLSSLVSPYNITVTKPTGTVDGDILFCWIAWYTTSGYTIDAEPSGWTKLGDYTANSDKYVLYYKVASGEGASWVWSFSNTVKVRAVCSCYTAGDFITATPIDVFSNTAYRTSNNQCIAASMNVTAVSSPLVFWAGCYSTSSKTYTKPSVPTSGWVEDDDAGSTTPDFWTEVCSMIWSGSGATGDMAATISSTLTAKHAFAVALKPKPVAWLAGVTNGIASVGGVVKPSRRVEGIANGVVTVTGETKISKKFAGIVEGMGTVAGFVKVAKNIAGLVSGVTATAGELTVGVVGVFLAGVTNGIASVAGIIKCLRPIVGVSAGLSDVSGNTKIARRVSGTIGGVATITGITKVSRKLVGIVVCAGTTTGAVGIVRRMVGLISGTTTVTGNIGLAVIKFLAGVISGTTIVSGNLVLARVLRLLFKSLRLLTIKTDFAEPLHVLSKNAPHLYIKSSVSRNLIVFRKNSRQLNIKTALGGGG